LGFSVKYYLINLKIAISIGLLEKHPFEVIFGFPYPTHPFWGLKAFLPDAKHLKVMRVEDRGSKVFLEDDSVWDIYFLTWVRLPIGFHRKRKSSFVREMASPRSMILSYTKCIMKVVL